MTFKTQFPPHTVLIYSVGLLGGSIGLGLKKSGFKGRIIGISSLPNIEKALSLGCIDEGYPYEELSTVISRCDVVFLCSPITIIIETLHNLAAMDLPKNLIITDVGSTKSKIAEVAVKVLPKHVHFIGGHPMAGSEKHGPAASDPYLFQNALYVLTPLTAQEKPIDTQLAQFLSKYLGCRYVFLKPDIHDTIAATVSHVPHLLAVALVNLAQQGEKINPGTMQLAAGGFRDLTRIASSPYKMWNDIFLTNKRVIAPLLSDYIELLKSIKHDLEKDNLENRFTSASQARSRIPLQHKGFLTPLFEILVIVKDQPGVISSISSALAKHQLNIKDIEVIKIREGEGGTLRLAFDSRSNAEKAILILNDNGFSAWERK